MKKDLSTQDNLLIIVNDSITTKVVELLNDLNKREVEFTPKNCKKIKITYQGNFYLEEEVKKEEKKSWRRRYDPVEPEYTWEELNSNNNSDYFYDCESETLSRVMLKLGEVLISLRKEKEDIIKSVQKIKDMGCLTEVYERDLITEKS